MGSPLRHRCRLLPRHRSRRCRPLPRRPSRPCRLLPRRPSRQCRQLPRHRSRQCRQLLRRQCPTCRRWRRLRYRMLRWRPRRRHCPQRPTRRHCRQRHQRQQFRLSRPPSLRSKCHPKQRHQSTLRPSRSNHLWSRSHRFRCCRRSQSCPLLRWKNRRRRNKRRPGPRSRRARDSRYACGSATTCRTVTQGPPTAAQPSSSL